MARLGQNDTTSQLYFNFSNEWTVTMVEDAVDRQFPQLIKSSTVLSRRQVLPPASVFVGHELMSLMTDLAVARRSGSKDTTLLHALESIFLEEMEARCKICVARVGTLWNWSPEFLSCSSDLKLCSFLESSTNVRHVLRQRYRFFTGGQTIGSLILVSVEGALPFSFKWFTFPLTHCAVRSPNTFHRPAYNLPVLLSLTCVVMGGCFFGLARA